MHLQAFSFGPEASRQKVEGVGGRKLFACEP